MGEVYNWGKSILSSSLLLITVKHSSVFFLSFRLLTGEVLAKSCITEVCDAVRYIIHTHVTRSYEPGYIASSNVPTNRLR